MRVNTIGHHEGPLVEEAVNADKVAEVGHSMHQPASVQSATFPLSFSARIQTWAALGKRAAGDRGVGWASHSCVLVRTHFYIFTLPFHHLLWPHEARVNLEARFDPSSHFSGNAVRVSSAYRGNKVPWLPVSLPPGIHPFLLPPQFPSRLSESLLRKLGGIRCLPVRDAAS